MTGECPFTHFSMQLSIPSSSTSFSLPCALTKEADTHGWLGTCAGVNPNRGAMVTGHGGGRLGECVAMRRVRGRLKNPDPEKESRWRQELPYPRTAPVSTTPRTPLPQLLFNQCPENPLGALKWKNVSMLGLSTQHQITRSLLTPAQPVSVTHFHKQAITTQVYGLLCPIVAFHQTFHWQQTKTSRGRERQQEN